MALRLVVIAALWGMASARTRGMASVASDASSAVGASAATTTLDLEAAMSDGVAPPSLPRRHLLGRGENAVVDANALTFNTSALRDALLDGYDKMVTPPGCVVNIQLSLQKLVEIDTSGQTISMLGWWRHYWNDARLVWNPDQWGGIGFVTFRGGGSSNEIWGPDNIVYESMETWDIIPDIDFQVYSDGSVFVSKPMVQKVPCPMDVQEFPFDIQHCHFSTGSWSYHGYMVHVIPRLHGGELVSAMAVDTYQPHTEFSLKRVVTDHMDTFYGCCPEPYPLITYELVLQRQSLTVRVSLARAARAPPGFLPPPARATTSTPTTTMLLCGAGQVEKII